jgi:hypothetical protein
MVIDHYQQKSKKVNSVRLYLYQVKKMQDYLINGINLIQIIYQVYFVYNLLVLFLLILLIELNLVLWKKIKVNGGKQWVN